MIDNHQAKIPEILNELYEHKTTLLKANRKTSFWKEKYYPIVIYNSNLQNETHHFQRFLLLI